MRTIYACSAVAAANYYTRYLTDSPGEVPGVWSGAQATELGLAGGVDGPDLLALLEGRNPITGTRLGRAFLDRYLANGKLVRAVAGFDLTFSAPKSVSALWALTQDERILIAHDRARWPRRWATASSSARPPAFVPTGAGCTRTRRA